MTPSYSLERVKALVRLDAYRITMQARRDAWELGFDERDLLAYVLALESRDFHKTMPSTRFSDRMQDVYRPRVEGRDLYVKVQIVGTSHEALTVVISFKDR